MNLEKAYQYMSTNDECFCSRNLKILADKPAYMQKPNWAVGLYLGYDIVYENIS